MTSPSLSLAEYVFPASFAQQRLWFLNSLVPKNPFYNVAAAIRLTGQLNVIALEQTFNEIVRRHEVLRTTFEMRSQLNQVVVEDATISLCRVDLSYLPASEREAAARKQAIALSQQPFDLTTDRLLRLTLFQLDEFDQILLLNLHHIIADGWSIGVLVRELSTLYTAFSAGNLSPLPELPIQYADFASWQREWLQEVLESQLSYWRSQLADLTILNLPTDRTRPAVPSFRGATHNLKLSKSLTASLVTLSEQAGVTLFMTLLAAFQILLYRYTGQSDIVLGSPIANRHQAELESLIGFFVNSLVLRTDLSGHPTFREVLLRVQEVTLGAYAHQDLPFEKLVQELHPNRDFSRHPLFQVAIALQNTPITALELPKLALTQFELDIGTSRLDLELHLWLTTEGLQGQIIYSTDLYDRTTITRLLGHFQTLLAGIVSNPEQRVADLPILTTTELQQLLSEWNQTHQDYQSQQCIHQLFETQASLTPKAIALVYENEQLTYQELNHGSNQLAHYLQKLGVAPEVMVGICLERSPMIIVAILGILKAGGAYVPLDPTYPPERLQFMCEDAQISMLLTQQSLVPLIQKWGDRQLICLDSDRQITQHSQENLNSGVTSANLAYVIYTSGSTGQPKGVLVEHRGLINLAQAQIQTFNLKPEHHILQFASLSFDASIFEIVMSWGVGATLYLIPEAARLGLGLISYLQDHAITHATLPPAVLNTLSPTKLPTLQVLISAGSACSLEIVANWADGRRFFNAYGLTETTVWSTISEVRDDKSISIGRAIANTQLYVLDANLQPVAIGIPGELYIGGIGLARGYLNRPELTPERFVANPFANSVETFHETSKPNRLYKTGDLVRYLLSGNLEFLGRIDNQVKIRGYRVELGEIANLLSQHPAVREAYIIAAKDAFDYLLVAYVVLNLELTTADLRRFVKEKLPDYMIPSAFVILSSLPLTPSGKVDESALIKPSFDREHLFIAPRTATEATLTKLWAQILNLERVGIQDNFFELGGDSLLAVRLLTQVNQQFEQIPLSNLFIAPTVEQFAALIEQDPIERHSGWSPLVPLQPRGAKTPFFCVHPIFGVVLPYYELACHLGTDQPFYGLQPFGIDGSHSPLTTIEEMAAGYIQAMRQVQPQGPYQLGGWSFGGLVAYEMAQQLSKAQQQVSLLAILDTLAPVSSNQLNYGDGLKFLLTTVTRSIYPFILDYWSLVSQNIISPHVWRSSLEQAAITNLIPQETRLRMLDELTMQRMMKIFYANSRATLNYTPQSYPDAIALFRTSAAQKKSADLTLGWSQLASDIQVQFIPGDHLTMLQKPHVQMLAQQLHTYLN